MGGALLRAFIVFKPLTSAQAESGEPPLLSPRFDRTNVHAAAFPQISSSPDLREQPKRACPRPAALSEARSGRSRRPNELVTLVSPPARLPASMTSLFSAMNANFIGARPGRYLLEDNYRFCKKGGLAMFFHDAGCAGGIGCGRLTARPLARGQASFRKSGFAAAGPAINAMGPGNSQIFQARRIPTPCQPISRSPSVFPPATDVRRACRWTGRQIHTHRNASPKRRVGLRSKVTPGPISRFPRRSSGPICA